MSRTLLNWLPSASARVRWSVVALVLALAVAATPASAQSLGWEGPTGVFVTPLALTAASPATGFGKPSVAYHFLNGGKVIGNYSTVSITEGLAKRFEFGYTAEIHGGGKDTVNAVNLSPLWTGTMSIVHGKAMLYPGGKSVLAPAISVGAIARFNDNNVGDGSNSAALHAATGTANATQTKTNADFYIVGTKIVTSISKKVPWIFNAGLRGTNASLWGLGGNTENYEARGFGALGWLFTLPNKGSIILASEVSQQPNHVLFTTTAGAHANILDIPTSEVYAVRITPSPKLKLNIDAGILQAAGHVGSVPLAGTTATLPVNLDARCRVAFALSYGF